VNPATETLLDALGETLLSDSTRWVPVDPSARRVMAIQLLDACGVTLARDIVAADPGLVYVTPELDELAATAVGYFARDGAVQGAREMATVSTTIRRLLARLIAAQRVVDAARRMPRRTPGPGAASSAHAFDVVASDVWELDNALNAYDGR
jgi:hypothetical protein